MQTAIQRQYAETGIENARRLLTLSLLVAFAVTALVDVTGPLWGDPLGFTTYGGVVRLAVFWAGVSAVTNSALGLLRSQDRLRAFASVSLLQSVVAESLSLLLVAVVRPTPEMFVLGQLVAQVGATAVALVCIPPKRLRWSDRALSLTSIAYGLPLVPAVLSTFVLNTADRLIIQGSLGLDAVARYQVSYNIGSIPLLLLGVLSSVWLPRIFATSEGGERAAVLSASRDALFRLLVPVIIGLSLGAPVMLRLWAPPEYEPDTLLVVTFLIIVAAVPYAASMPVSNTLLAGGRTRSIAAVASGIACVNVVLNLALIPYLGIAGSATATLIAHCLSLVLLRLRARALDAGAPSPVALRIQLALVILFSALVTQLPTTVPFLVARALAAAACVGWFALVIVRITAVRKT
jgi:O-antigen/teichoic acid export membrane protein